MTERKKGERRELWKGRKKRERMEKESCQ